MKPAVHLVILLFAIESRTTTLAPPVASLALSDRCAIAGAVLHAQITSHITTSIVDAPCVREVGRQSRVVLVDAGLEWKEGGNQRGGELFRDGESCPWKEAAVVSKALRAEARLKKNRGLLINLAPAGDNRFSYEVEIVPLFPLKANTGIVSLCGFEKGCASKTGSNTWAARPGACGK